MRLLVLYRQCKAVKLGGVITFFPNLNKDSY